MNEGAIELSKNKYEIDMCNGTIMDKLVSFAIPLMVSGILQLAFNAVDIIVVGRFSGSQALAAVGSTTALINVFTNLFIGISLGANVLAARFYAAGKDREMSETVHTSITLALISGIMMAVIGVLLAKWALEIMGTPDDVIGQSALYMRIYFMGMPFFMLYNYFRNCKCRAEHDTGYSFSYGSCRGCNWNNYFTADFLCAGTDLSVPVGRKLSASFLQTEDQWCLHGTDFPGGSSGGNPEYGHQFVKCTVAVFG